MGDLDRTRLISKSPPIGGQEKIGGTAPEPTQAITPQSAGPPVAASTSQDLLLSDAERKRRVEADLLKLGMSPDEIQRLVNAEAHTSDLAAVQLPPSGKATSRTSIETLAADLSARATSATVNAAKEVNLNLPAFRPPSPQELRQAEQLLRDAAMLRRRDKYAESMAKLREAIEMTPGDASALEMLGDLYQGTGRVDEALAAYSRAQEADPKRASSEKKYADLIMQQQRWSVGDPEAVAKNPFAAVLLSALIPGAGQIHNGDFSKGAFFFGAALALIRLIGWSRFGFAGEHRGHGVNVSLLALFAIAGAIYIIALVDANMAARSGGVDRVRGDGWSV